MKSIGGFYYVRADGEDYECKARGSFRKSGNSPVAGDRVNISVPNDGFCAIEEILPRKNKLRRPALANLDILLLVCLTVSTCALPISAPPETEPSTQYYTDPYVAPDTTVQPVTDDPEL